MEDVLKAQAGRLRDAGNLIRFPQEDISYEEQAEWYSRLAWEKELDMQKEHRLRREGLLWRDPALEGLDENTRKWEVLQLGFQQVEDILEGIGLPELADYFVAKGFTYGAKLRWMTRKFLDTHMTSLTESEKEQILDACATACRDENIRLFPYRYGNPDLLLLECPKGRAFLSEKLEQGWFGNMRLLSAAHEKDYHKTRFQIAPADYNSIEDFDAWALGLDSAGRAFLFPLSDKVPPCIRNPKLHSLTALDIAMDWTTLRSVSAGMDAKLCFYDWKKDQRTHDIALTKLAGSGKADECFTAVDVEFEMEKMAAGTSSGEIEVIDLSNGQLVSELRGHSCLVRRVAVDWEQNRLVSCSADCHLNVYDLRSGKLLRNLPQGQMVDAMDVDPSGEVALCAAVNQPTRLWDLTTGYVIQEYTIPGHRPNWINVDWTTMTACSGANDNTVKLWDLETGELARSIECQHQMTQSLDVDWDAGLLLTGSFDAQMKLWDIKSGALQQQFVSNSKSCLTRVLLKPESQ